MRERVTVYFDYVCPYSWRAAELMALIAEPLRLEVSWQHFSLFQSEYSRGSTGGSGWQLWNQPLDGTDGNGCRGLLPFLASHAARRQGKDAHDAYRLALQRANHVQYQPYSMSTVMQVASQVGLDLPRFEHELANPEGRTALAVEHTRAESLDVFGTPTIVFPGGQTAYLRLGELVANTDEAITLFEDVRAMLERYPYLQTVRRPRSKGN